MSPRISPYALPGIPHKELEKAISSLPAKIFQMVTDEFNIPKEKMVAKTRKGEVAEARHIAMYLIRKRTRLSLNEIGEIFCRDHTTIIHAMNTVNDHIDTEPEYADRVQRLLDAI